MIFFGGDVVDLCFPSQVMGELSLQGFLQIVRAEVGGHVRNMDMLRVSSCG